MPAQSKVEQAARLGEFLAGATIVIGTSYSGLNVAQMEGLRRALRQSGADYRVVKNRLALRAARELGRENLEDILQGAVGLVVGRADPAGPARALTTHVRSARLNLPLTGAIIDGQVLTAAEVDALANLPPREVLLGQVLGGMQGVLQGLVTVLSAHLTGLVVILEQRRRQLEEGS